MIQQKTYVFNVEALVKRQFKNVSVSAVTEAEALEKVKYLIERTFEKTEVVSVSCQNRTRKSRLSLKTKMERIKKAGFQYIGEPLDESRTNSLWYSEANMPEVAFQNEEGKVFKVSVRGPVTVNVMEGENIIAGYNGNAGGTLADVLGEYIQCDGDIRKGLREKSLSILNTNWFQIEGTEYWAYDLKEFFEERNLINIFG